MEKQEIFPNAPIKEAVIDIRFSSKFASLDVIEDAIASIPAKYDFGEQDAISGHHLEINVTGQGDPSVKEKLDQIGIRIKDHENNLVVIFKTDGFTVSKLPPYTNWEDFKSIAQDLWSTYFEKLVKVDIKRLAVRYINEIQLPMIDSSVELNEYLVNEPLVPRGIKSDISDFFNRIVIPFPKLSAKAVIIQALGEQTNDSIFVILDFDVYCDDISIVETQDMWTYLDKLRDIKNQAFTGSLTDKALENFR
jgi:uncharacterized protein (TIGR04255 family)